MTLPKPGIETFLREFFKATIAGGCCSPAGSPHPDCLAPRNEAGVKITEPISDLLPVEAVVGIRRETFLAVLLLIFVSLVAGLVAKTNAGRRFIRCAELLSGRSSSVSTGEEHGRGSCTCRKC